MWRKPKPGHESLHNADNALTKFRMKEDWLIPEMETFEIIMKQRCTDSHKII